jgi:hypothetical protein
VAKIWTEEVVVLEDRAVIWIAREDTPEGWTRRREGQKWNPVGGEDTRS